MDDLQPGFTPTIPALIRYYVDHFSDRAQLIDGSLVHTFSQLDDYSAKLAQGLVSQGMGKGSRIAILIPNGAHWVAAWQAVNRIGAIAVFVSTFSKPRELHHILQHADVQSLLMADSYLKHDYISAMEQAVPGLGGSDSLSGPLLLHELPYLRSIWIFGERVPAWSAGSDQTLVSLGEAAGIDRDLLSCIEAQVSPADEAIMIYTSGTTSVPKAIVHTQGTVVRKGFALARYSNYQPGDRSVTTMPLFWVGGLVMGLLCVNISGAAMVSPNSPGVASVVEAIREQGCNTINLWADQVIHLLKRGELQAEELAGLKPANSMQLGLFAGVSPDRVPNSLGMSETFASHSMEPIGYFLPEDRAGSFGRPLPGMELKIVHPQTLEELPRGEIGELCVRGYSLMCGYYKVEREEAFMPDGFFRTGDHCWISEDNYLFFDGRTDEMIKTRGANVAPREVEQVLNGDSAVSEAHVLKAKDSKGLDFIAAVVVPVSIDNFDIAALHQRMERTLSDYKIPKVILTVEASELPRTPSQKVRKVQLAKLVNSHIKKTSKD